MLLHSSVISPTLRWFSSLSATNIGFRTPIRALAICPDIYPIDRTSQAVCSPYKARPRAYATGLTSGTCFATTTTWLSRPSFIRTCSTHTRMTGGPVPTPDPSKGYDEYRLPTDLKPTHYDVTIRTDLEKLTFDGFVKVQ